MTSNIVIIISTSIISIIIYLLLKLISNKFENIGTYSLVLLTVFLVVCLIVFPHNTINASLNGLITWSSIVLPSLLPFFIGSEILIGLGVVNFIGVLLSPIMYPLFRVSGKGSFPFAMSIASGYPVGVTLVSKLRIQNAINRIEAQRLVSFCSTSGPLFIIGAVALFIL